MFHALQISELTVVSNSTNPQRCAFGAPSVPVKLLRPVQKINPILPEQYKKKGFLRSIIFVWL